MDSLKNKKVVLAFSGGLDTSFCVIYLKKMYDVITVTVDTGFSKSELKEIEKKSEILGAKKHYCIDARNKLFRIIEYIIKGNIMRGDYPLCVASERVVQAKEIANIAIKEKAAAVAHGCTAAGNDQVRFDIAFNVLAPKLNVIAPIRELGITRKDEIRLLKKYGIDASAKTYSINKGLWGTTRGGGEINNPWLNPKIHAEPKLLKPREIIIGFENGIPISVDNTKMDGISLIKKLNKIAGKYGVGYGIHLGNTVIGIKGRIVFSAPAATVLIKAHKELEKLVHTKWQQFWKDHISDFYGSLLHEGLYFDPVMRDIEALIDSSQRNVSGDVRIRLCNGRIEVIGCKSPYSLTSNAVYGEKPDWSSEEVEGFSKIFGLQSVLASRCQK